MSPVADYLEAGGTFLYNIRDFLYVLYKGDIYGKTRQQPAQLACIYMCRSQLSATL